MLTHILDALSAYILAPMTAAAVFGSGIFLLGRYRGFPLTRPATVIASLRTRPSAERGGISPKKALLLALAGTLGAGNIVGVSAAIIEGGAGAVFWMWMAALAAMPVKYAEVALSMKRRVRGEDGKMHGGAMYYLPKALAVAFAAVCLLSSFTLGNVIQVRSAADALQSTLSVDPLVCSAVMAALAAVTLIGGVKWMASLTGRLIPLLCGGYVAAAAVVIAVNHAALPEAFARIFAEAFGIDSFAGGVGGFALSRLINSVLRPMRFGVGRGVMSNEAGCGTAPIAHAESEQTDPIRQGCLGVIEVFVDTVLLCTLTALVILTSPLPLPTDVSDAMALVSGAFEAGFAAIFGESGARAAGVFLALSIAAFAFATLICWAHYGSEALYYLGDGRKLGAKKRAEKADISRSRRVIGRHAAVAAPPRKRRFGARSLYIAVYSLAALLGALPLHGALWAATDIGVGLMAVMNLGGMWWGRKE